MQSYAHIVDDTLDEAALQTLGDRLGLPRDGSTVSASSGARRSTGTQ